MSIYEQLLIYLLRFSIEMLAYIKKIILKFIPIRASIMSVDIIS